MYKRTQRSELIYVFVLSKNVWVKCNVYNFIFWLFGKLLHLMYHSCIDNIYRNIECDCIHWLLQLNYVLFNNTRMSITYKLAYILLVANSPVNPYKLRNPK